MVRESDCAKWILGDPRGNFLMAEKDDELGIAHLGVEADTPDEHSVLRNRTKRAGGTLPGKGGRPAVPRTRT